MKDQVLLNKVDFSCADYMGVWLLLTSGCLHKQCSPDCVTGILPIPVFVYGHPTQQLLQVWTFDSTVHFCAGRKTSALPGAEIWTGHFLAYTYSRTDTMLFLPSFSQSSWETTKSQINSPSQRRPLPHLTCNQDHLVQFALSSRQVFLFNILQVFYAKTPSFSSSSSIP